MVISVPDSPRREAIFIGVFNTMNSLLATERFLQRLSLVIRSSVGPGFTFQTIDNKMSLLFFMFFLSLYQK